jgi:hypothetical protein
MIEMKIISTYTTEQAVEDGVLISVPADLLKEVGISYPVFMTSAVHDRYVEVPDELEGIQDYSARLFDIIYMLRQSMKRFVHDTDYYTLTVMLQKDAIKLANEKISDLSEYHKDVTLKTVLEPYLESAKITILLPSED